jgi:membrane-bound ClpP family serine protease
MEFFEGMDVVLKTFWFIALPASLIFVIQTILTFLGADATDGLDADFDGDFESDGGFQIFSLRNMINFLLGFGWAGVSLYDTIDSLGLLIAVSVLVGLIFVAFFFIVIKQLMKLSEDNTFKISETVDKTGEVYLKIPALKTGKGKILISIRGSMHELEAVSDNESIAQGTLVKVVRIENERILVVTPL